MGRQWFKKIHPDTHALTIEKLRGEDDDDSIKLLQESEVD